MMCVTSELVSRNTICSFLRVSKSLLIEKKQRASRGESLSDCNVSLELFSTTRDFCTQRTWVTGRFLCLVIGWTRDWPVLCSGLCNRLYFNKVPLSLPQETLKPGSVSWSLPRLTFALPAAETQRHAVVLDPRWTAYPHPLRDIWVVPPPSLISMRVSGSP